jgi:hypothetical protein
MQPEHLLKVQTTSRDQLLPIFDAQHGQNGSVAKLARCHPVLIVMVSNSAASGRPASVTLDSASQREPLGAVVHADRLRCWRGPEAASCSRKGISI